MKLGDPATPFYFHVDTGSGPTWVYCTDRGQPSSIKDFVSTSLSLGVSNISSADGGTYEQDYGSITTWVWVVLQF